MKTNIKWGILLGIALVVGTQILTWLGLGTTNWFVILTYVLVVTFIAFGLRSQVQLNNGKLPFVRALTSVVVIILISRIIFQIYMFIYTQYVDPEWVNTTAETWSQMLADAGVGQEQIEKRIQTFRKSYEVLPMFTVEIVYLAIPQFILGILTSLFFVKWKKDVSNKS